MNFEELEKQSLAEQLPIELLKRELDELESGSYATLTDDELQTKVRSLHAGFQIRAPAFDPNMLVFRAVRVNERPAQMSRISYPPSQLVKQNGRLNRLGQTIFYGSVNLFACLQECACKEGEIFALSAWLTTETMMFNQLGYHTTARELNRQELPNFVGMSDDTERNALLRRWQARVFTQHVPSGHEDLYRLPIALTDFALLDLVQNNPTAPKHFSGVIYPSIAFHLMSDNFAIRSEEVDSKMALCEVTLLVIDSLTEKSLENKTTSEIRCKSYDVARPDVAGDLVWGQTSQIIYPEGVDPSAFKVRILPPVR